MRLPSRRRHPHRRPGPRALPYRPPRQPRRRRLPHRRPHHPRRPLLPRNSHARRERDERRARACPHHAVKLHRPTGLPPWTRAGRRLQLIAVQFDPACRRYGDSHHRPPQTANPPGRRAPSGLPRRHLRLPSRPLRPALAPKGCARPGHGRHGPAPRPPSHCRCPHRRHRGRRRNPLASKPPHRRSDQALQAAPNSRRALVDRHSRGPHSHNVHRGPAGHSADPRLRPPTD